MRTTKKWMFEIDDIRLWLSEEVYEPAEDTFLLLKHVKTTPGPFLDLGCGSGIIGLVNAKHTGNEVWCSDIDEKAIHLVKKNAEENNLHVRTNIGDLFENLPMHYFRTIAFNAPYLPKEDNILAFDGGEGGESTITRFLHCLPDYLLPGGCAFLVLSSLSPLRELEEKAREQGLKKEKVDEERCFFETIEVWKLWKQ